MKNKKDILAEAVDSLSKIPVSDDVLASVVEATLKTLSKVKVECNRDNDKQHFTIKRIRLMKRYTKIAVAAVIVCAVLASVTVFDKTTSIAYALEQSIKASHTIQTVHLKFYRSSKEIEQGNFTNTWMRFDDGGKLMSCRLEMENTPDGPKTIVWNQGTAKVWMNAKKVMVVIREEKMAREMEKMAIELDPKLTLQRIYEKKEKGELELEIIEPESDGEPIRVETRNTNNKERATLLVDAETKLLKEVTVYKTGDLTVADVKFEFYSYNEPLDDALFELSDLPEDTVVIDQIKQVVGIPRGDLSEEQIVAKVAREFFEALIEKDYARAGTVFEGMPADQMENFFGKIDFRRIISIGEVSTHSNPATRGFVILCEIELMVDGKIATQTFNPGIRPVHSNPDRWTIFGGI